MILLENPRRPALLLLTAPLAVVRSARNRTAGGGECTGSGATICIADYPSGDFGNFCTKLCMTDADCGVGAVCSGSGSTAACFPEGCTPTLGADAGAADGG